MPQSIRLRVFGNYALFSRPELKVERYSYDVMTPSAARGILDAIYYHPGLAWHIGRIIVESPIRFTNIRRNEVLRKVSAADLLAAANGADEPIFIDRGEAIAQRAATILRDVSYVIEANFTVIPEKMGREDSADKFYAIFCNRARKGRFFHQPYLGCREFPAFFELITDEGRPPEPISESRDLGIMLYDMDYSGADITPMFFHAEMVQGVVDVAGKEILRRSLLHWFLITSLCGPRDLSRAPVGAWSAWVMPFFCGRTAQSIRSFA